METGHKKKKKTKKQVSIFSLRFLQGASIIRMLESFVGRENLRKGLRSYLNEYKYTNARTDNLWESIGQVGNFGQ